MECPQPIVNFVRNRIQQWSDRKNGKRGIFAIWDSILQAPRVPFPNALVTAYSQCDFEQVACTGELIGRWFVTMSDVVDCDPSRSRKFENGVPTEITKLMLFDFAIAEDCRKFIIIETDMDDHVKRGIHEII